MIDAITLSRYLLAKTKGTRDEMTNSRLQRLLYIAQKLHLGKTGEPLFANKIEAWPMGPCVPDVYYRYNNLVRALTDEDKSTDDMTSICLEIANRVIRIREFEPEYQLNKRTGAWVRVFNDGRGVSNAIPLNYITEFG